jgi:DNA-binding NarL/FixJ family response regulator
MTKRQREVYSLLQKGLKDEAIAEQLGIRVTTVRTHKARVLDEACVGTLAARERELANLVVAGFSNQEIGDAGDFRRESRDLSLECSWKTHCQELGASSV